MFRRGLVVVAGLAGLVLAGAGATAATADTLPDEPLAGELVRVRRVVGCDTVPTEDDRQRFAFRGRAATEITGRERDGSDTGPIRDFAVFDLGAARVVSYVCFAHASTRRAGEAIVSLAEISSLADAMARAVLPGANLALESIQRYRTSGQESVYYEARYTPNQGEPPFLEPPVRLLFNASTGELFRLDLDADWLNPAALPRQLISRKAAERIAALVLARHDFSPVFGPGAAVAKAGPAEMYMVRANGALGLSAGEFDGRARPAWVVPFRVGGAGARTHALFVDAATGKPLGGSIGGEADTADPAQPGDAR